MSDLTEDTRDYGAEVDRIIMSEGLNMDLGDLATVEQFLIVNDARFICNVTRANFAHAPDGYGWEFDLEVPGITLSDVTDVTIMTFSYGDVVFKAQGNFELTNPDNRGPVMSFKAERIFNKDE